ncbi:MAG: hypothetical protein UHY68_06335 [Acutalibacteraceae bacterium]|nr:hypothetical protein [Acutalibacteraceae bacterium]
MKNNLPLEIERKYLIKFPDVSLLEQQPVYMKIEMEQAYLKDQGETAGMRIRKSTLNGKTTYKKTFKKNITNVTRIEIEDDISEQSWLELLKEVDPESTPIKKVRHCFMYNSQLFELDIYPFWSDRAILELEISSEDQQITLPPFIEVIKEVTEDKRYTNRSLSYNILTEEI